MSNTENGPALPRHDRLESGSDLLQVARVRFVGVDVPRRLSFPEDYRRFVRPAPPAPGIISVPVALCRQERIVRPAGIFFTTAGAWSMARDAEGYLLCIGPREPEGELDFLIRFTAGEPPALAASFRELDANPLAYPADQAILMYLLAPRRGAIHHAAGFGWRGRGFAFLGRSGAGKTTLSRLLLGREGWQPLSDDRVIVRGVGEGHLLFGTPWPGEAGLAENGSHPLHGLCFLRQASENRLRPLRPREAMERLLPVSSIPWFDREAMLPQLDYLGALAADVPAWELEFRNDASLPAFLESHLPSAAAPREERGR